jgi:hypothetical protein
MANQGKPLFIPLRSICHIHRRRLETTVDSSFGCVRLYAGGLVYPSPLLLGQGGYELAAEGGDVCDHAAPDQVKMD